MECGHPNKRIETFSTVCKLLYPLPVGIQRYSPDHCHCTNFTAARKLPSSWEPSVQLEVCRYHMIIYIVYPKSVNDYGRREAISTIYREKKKKRRSSIGPC